jgi:hypothetical protein
VARADWSVAGAQYTCQPDSRTFQIAPYNTYSSSPDSPENVRLKTGFKKVRSESPIVCLLGGHTLRTIAKIYEPYDGNCMGGGLVDITSMKIGTVPLLSTTEHLAQDCERKEDRLIRIRVTYEEGLVSVERCYGGLSLSNEPEIDHCETKKIQMRPTLDTHVSGVVSAHSRLSVKEVQAIAEAAAQSASYDMSKFVMTEDYFSPIYFDPVTKVWVVTFKGREPTVLDFRKQQPSGEHRKKFRVLVYDETSRTEVTCLGMTEPNSTVETKDLPLEVQSFVGDDERATDLYCADLNGDGLQDYLLVTQDRNMKILLRKPDGKLALAVSNGNAVQAPYDQGINGAYNVIARRNKFSVTNLSAGSGGGDTYVFYFEYSPAESTWILTRAEKSLSGYAHSDDDHGGKWLPRDFGLITFAEFNKAKFR